MARDKLAKNVAFQYGLQIAKYLFPLITIPYLTRVLGPDIYDVRAYVLAVMLLMQVFLEFGFTPYGTRVVAAASSRETDNAVTSSITLLRIFACIIGALVLIPLVIFIPMLTPFPLFVAVSYLCVCFKALLPDFIFQGKEEMGIITYRFVVSQIVAIALIFLTVRGPEHLLLVAIYEALAAFIALAWSWKSVWFDYGIRFISPSKPELLETLRESWVFFISTAADVILTSLTTVFIGLFITESHTVSYWSIAMTAITAVHALYAPIVNGLYPHMVKERDFTLFKKLLYLGTPVNIVGTIAFALLANVIMLILGGQEYVEGAYVIVYVAPMLIFSFPAIMFGNPVLAAVGHTKELARSSVVAACFQIIGLAILAATGAFTIEAVAILRCLAEAVLAAMRAFYVWRLRNDGLDKSDA